MRTRVVVDFFPHANGQVYLDRLGTKPLLTFSAAPHDEIRLLLKRSTDILLAAAALVLMLPFMVVIALMIPLTSRPAIFRRERCGLNGRHFVFYKFRSMCNNAEELKASLTHLNQRSRAFKIPNDPRLTRIGWLLRKFSIDEWPQLWDVLKGDMSLAGPRPAVPEEVEMYSEMAAPQASHAAGAHVPVGDSGPRRPGFRNLDEDGHAIHRYLVLSARLEDNPTNESASAYGAGSKLIKVERKCI
jgi:lipopolysaccharide/colanic/teichoic acid biosynthesis glycosyltransferase